MLQSAPILSIITFLPLVGAGLILLARAMARAEDAARVAENARWLALFTTTCVFALAVWLVASFDRSNAGFQFVEDAAWLGENIRYRMGVDGVSILFVLLTAFLTPLCILASWHSIEERVAEYMIAFLVLETLMIGVFCALDLILFYLFFEGGLIPMFLIIGIWGGANRVYAAFKFFLYTLAGSLLMLVAVIAIYLQAGTTDIASLHQIAGDAYALAGQARECASVAETGRALSSACEFMLAGHGGDPQTAFDAAAEAALSDGWFAGAAQNLLWLAFFASFAVKMPMWPVHTWLPDAHVEAPTAGSVILAGILLKMGGYGFLRFSLPLFPEASVYFTPLVFALSVIAIVYTSLVAFRQEDVKKLIAYSSVAHMGFVTMGLFALNAQGLQGAIFQMLSHGVISGALFLCVGVIYDRMHTREIAAYGGLVNRMPVYAAIFMLFTMGNVGLPGTSGFIGEFLTMLGTFQVSTWAAFGAASGVILSAVYALTLYRRVAFGEIVNDKLLAIDDVDRREILIFAPLVAATLVLGVYPALVTDLTDASVQALIEHIDAARAASG